MGCANSTPETAFPVDKKGHLSIGDELCDYSQATAPHFRMYPEEIRPIVFAKRGFASKEVTPPVTVLDAFKAAKERHGASPALKVERPFQKWDPSSKPPPALPESEWTTWTWEAFHNDARRVAKALLAVGTKRFDGVTIYGFNSPEWVIAEMGAMMAGALPTGLYVTDAADAVKFKTMHSSSRVAFVEEPSKLKSVYDKVVDGIPRLTHIVIMAPDYTPSEQEATLARASNPSNPVKVMSWNQFKELGNSVEDAKVEEVVASILPESPCCLIYTSGTTGNPKAVQISHDNVMVEARLFTFVNPQVGEAGQERVISYLPLSHIAAMLVDLILPISTTAYCPGYYTTYFARNYDLKAGSFGERLKIAQPTVFFGVPRVWEKIAEKLQAIGAQVKGLKKVIATWAKKKGLEYELNKEIGKSGMKPSGFDRADHLVLSKVRAALGLAQCKIAMSGAAPIARATLEYFASLGIVIYETYGMSETCGGITGSIPSAHRFGTVGFALPGCEVKVFRSTEEIKSKVVGGGGATAAAPQKPTLIEADLGADVFHPSESEQGELCFRGRTVMIGYLACRDLNDEAEILKKNLETIDEQGWCHSGDKGTRDVTNFFRITGRYKELIIGAGGENIAPVPIEDRFLELVPAASKVIMIGDKRKFNILLVTLKQEDASGETPGNGRLIAPALGLSPTSTTTEQAMDDPIFISTITDAVSKLNADSSVVVSNACAIQRFTILPRDFSINTDELTPTLKFKRSKIADKFAKTIDAVYAAEDTKQVYVKYVAP